MVKSMTINRFVGRSSNREPISQSHHGRVIYEYEYLCAGAASDETYQPITAWRGDLRGLIFVGRSSNRNMSANHSSAEVICEGDNCRWREKSSTPERESSCNVVAF
jgi:hypothetical protein